MKRSLGYLSGAPRSSTRPDAEETGPRAHILGVIHAFQALGWEVKPFIVGDMVPSKWVTKGSGKTMKSSLGKKLAVDILRLGLGMINTRRAWAKIGSQVDWVYERFGVFQLLGWTFKKHGIPWILETNAPLFYEGKADRKSLILDQLAKNLERKAYQNCDVLVCITHELKNIIVQELKIPSEKIVVMPNGVDTSLFSPTTPSKRLFATFTVGFVGRLSPWQGLDTLLDAVYLLAQEKIKICVVIVGDGPMRTNLEKQTKKLGLEDQVAFVGQLEHSKIPEYIGGFDVGYCGQIPLKIGTMYLSPIKLYEYMSMAKPVVASFSEESQRVIQEHKTGFLFPPRDPQNLKKVLFHIYQNQEKLLSMGKKAREEIMVHHSWEHRVKFLIQQVEKILSLPNSIQSFLKNKEFKNKRKE